MPLLHFMLVGCAQLVGIGTIYFTIAVISPALSRDTGVSLAMVFGLLSSAMLTAGLLGPTLGRQIDRGGARGILIAGSVMGALGLVGLSAAQGVASIGLSLLALQIGSQMALYETIFPALAKVDAAGARRRIATVTLFGGFASTVFWPVTGLLSDWLGWRQALMVLAALELAVCIPIYVVAFAPRRQILEPSSDIRPAEPAAALPPVEPLPRRAALQVGILLAIAIAAMSFVFNAIELTFAALFASLGAAPGTIIAIAAMKGPASVIARAAELIAGERVHPLTKGIAMTAGMALSLVIGAFGAPNPVALWVFAMLLGTTQGLFSIVRGTIPLALFGAGGFGELLGRIGIARQMAIASAPAVTAFVIDHAGADHALGLMAVLSLVALVALAAVARIVARVRAAA